MTAKQAYTILMSKNPAIKVGKSFEYESVFLFHLAPDMLLLSKSRSPMLDCLVSVNKATGEVRDFKPFYISLEEYRSGKEIPTSVYKR
jgi:hypothetical protein